jgi:hypothetical protein
VLYRKSGIGRRRTRKVDEKHLAVSGKAAAARTCDGARRDWESTFPLRQSPQLRSSPFLRVLLRKVMPCNHAGIPDSDDEFDGEDYVELHAHDPLNASTSHELDSFSGTGSTGKT